VASWSCIPSTRENRLSNGDDMWASGPSEASGPILAAFADEYRSTPDRITEPVAIALFEELRRHPRRCRGGVGGEIHHTTIIEDGATTVVCIAGLIASVKKSTRH
jgi:hypothetical protein